MRPLDYIEKDQLKYLKSFNNFIGVRDLFIRVIFNIILVYSMFFLIEKNYIYLVLIWYIYSVQFQFWGYAGLGHEALHERIFSNKKWNSILYEICSILTWNNGKMFKDDHLLHHRATFSEADKEAHSEINWQLSDIARYFLIDYKSILRKIQYIFFNIFGLYPNKQKLPESYKRSAQRVLFYNFLLYASIFYFSESFLLTALLFLSPFTGTLLVKILAKAQHHHLQEFKDLGPLKNSRTLKLPYLISFFYANMNFHAEHHLSPAIPYYNLPKLHKILREKKLVQESISLWQFIKSMPNTV